jgi:hypothetical protein
MPKISLAAPAEKPEQAQQPPKSAAADDAAPLLADRVRKEASIGRDVRAKSERRADKKKDAVAGQLANSPPAPAAAKLAESNEAAQSQVATGSYSMAKAARVQQHDSALAGAKPAGVAGALAMEEKQQQPTATAPAVPSANETVEVTAQAEVAQMQKAKSQDRAQSDLDRMSVARAGPAANARATTTGVSVGGAASQMSSESAAVTGGPLMKAAASVSPHWRLSSEGALERSTDAGRTWQLVRVAAPPPTLRSFSTLGHDIWAGGAGGALYHSADNGRTWTRVTAKAGDVVLVSDIVRVEFTDAQHGALLTVSGETWTTGDAGLTWSVRR